MDSLRIIPIGGLGEIGKNMMVIDSGEDMVVVDAGLMFPEEEMLGIDLVIPDITYLVENIGRLRALLITHGHEDHIGALPYLLHRLPGIPIYATKLTAGLIQVKLRESRLLDVPMHISGPGSSIPLGDFVIEPFRVNHSIPDAVGLAIRTPIGTVIHTGDFKFDMTPVDGQPADLKRIEEYGDEGVLLLCSDSTYSEREGWTPSEQVVGVALDKVLAEAAGRVIIATFASLISRIQQVVNAAVKTQRKVVVSGRSMERNVEIATDLGFLTVPQGIIIRQEEIARYQPRDLVIITTGSQGEPMSALSRIANREHRHIKVIPGDTVVISATPIPGNETLINRTIDNLFKQGAEVLYSRVSNVHVQGHASQEELKKMLSLVRPEYFMPVHGEYRMLIQHAKLAQSMGVVDDNIFVLEDGEVLEIGDLGASIVDRIPISEVYVDGLTVGDVTQVVLRDRRQLAGDGILVAVFEIDRKTGKLVDEPDIFARGFVFKGDFADLSDKARELMVTVLNSQQGEHLADWKFVNQKVKDLLSRFVWDQTRSRPMILPVVVEV